MFNRSHYEDVLVPRVHGQLDDEPAGSAGSPRSTPSSGNWPTAGTTIIKCFLHISYGEQRDRLLARLDDPTKLWKFNPADIDERARWPDYQSAYAAVLSTTSTEQAPWYVVPGDRKWYRNWAIGRLLAESLDELELSYPQADFDIEQAGLRLQPPF